MSSKIAIRFCPPVPTWGSQRTFAQEFLPELLLELPDSTVYSSIASVGAAAQNWHSALNPLTNGSSLRRILAVLRFQFSFEQELASSGVRVLFCPFHNDALAFPRRIRQVVIVHDLLPMIFPREFRMSRLLWATIYRATIRNSAHVICVSEATRRELVSRLKVPSEKISVIHNGYRLPTPVVRRANRARILYVASAHSIHKNIPTLLRAFAQSSLKKSHELRIVGVSHRRGTPLITAAIQELDLTDKVRLLEHLDSQSMRDEYESASIFVYPSLCEGFGLPLLEAMAHGIPVCASRVSAMPEIAGNAAVYFDPADAADIARKMELISTNSEFASDLISRGYENLSRFSWKRSASACADICRIQARLHC